MTTTIRNRENLALVFQEILTATVRLRADRQNVPDVQSFRSQIRGALNAAEHEARRKGYSAEDFRVSAFAVVAFVDESVLNSRNPVFASWPRKPLQEELFGGHVAGETFFEYLAGLLRASDSMNVADVLEVYELCLLLGYQGRYTSQQGGELQRFKHSIAEKIHRIRGTEPLASNWAPQTDRAPLASSDPMLRKLGYLAMACAALAFVLFLVFKLSLTSKISTAQQLATPHIGSTR